MQQSKRNYLRVHDSLRAAIEVLGKQGHYDIVLIDCPPNFNIVTKNAIVASQHIVIPAKPDYLSTLGIDYLQRSVNDLVTEFNEYAALDPDNIKKIDPKIMGVIFTMVQITSNEAIAAQKQFISQTKRLGVKIFPSFFRMNNTIFATSPQYLLPTILATQESSQGTYKTIADEIKKFVDEFENYLNLEK